MQSPGLLAGNPPPRRGAPGDDLTRRRPASGKRGDVAVGLPRKCGGRPMSLTSELVATCAPRTDAPAPDAAAPAPDAAAADRVAPLLPVVGADTQVPLVDGTTRAYANLDCAASAPALEA